MSTRIAPWPSTAATRPTTTSSSPTEPATAAQPAQPTDVLTAPNAAPAAADPQAVLRARLAASPETTRALAVLNGLQQRREELTAELNGQNRELEQWREFHGGFDSVARLGAGVGQLVSNLVHLKGEFWKGVGEKITDAETLEKAPQRDRIDELRRGLAEVDAAIAAASTGKPIAITEGSDYALKELAELQKSGAEKSPVQLMESRSTEMKGLGGQKRFAAAFDAYLGAAEAYFAVPSEKGECIAYGADGKPSVAAKVNALITTGALDRDGKLVLTAEELEGAIEAINKERGGDLAKKSPAVKALLDQLPESALRAEVDRLRKLEQSPALKGQVAKAQALQKDLDSVRPHEGFLASFGRGIVDILDSPETWAMVGVGGLVSGTGKRLLCTPLTAATTTSRKVALNAGALAIDGVLFHTAMNGFNLARQKPDRATWSPVDYAKSIILFEALGGLAAFRTARGLNMAAVEGWRKPVRAARFLAEEAAVLSIVGVAESLAREGNLKHARDILVENFQFLLAVRMVCGGRELFNRKVNAADAELAVAQSRFLDADRRFTSNGSKENLEQSIEAFSAFAKAHVRANLAQARSLLPPTVTPSIRAVSAELPADRYPTYERLAQELGKVYERFPSLKVNTDPALLLPAAREVLGAQRGEWVGKALEDPIVFEPARKSAIRASEQQPSKTPPRTAVISGGGPSGLMAAIALARSGYSVKIAELRNDWTRRNQLLARQALPDELATLDPRLGHKLVNEVAEKVDGVEARRSGSDEVKKIAAPDALPVDATRAPHGTDGAFQSVSYVRVEAQKLEKMLVEYIDELNAAAVKDGREPPIQLEKNTTVLFGEQNANGQHSVSLQRMKRGENGRRVSDGEAVSAGTPDLVIVSEGAGSPSRTSLGIQSLNTSPDSKFVMGILKTDQANPRSLRLAREDVVPEGTRSPVTLRTAVQGFGETAQNVLVATEVPAHVNLKPQAEKPGTPEYAEKKKELETEFLRQRASEVMGIPREKLNGYELEWYSPEFSVQQHISTGAKSGTNVALMGDAVGNASFIAGGGMMTAAVPHMEALKRLVHSIERGQDRRGALERYEEDATAASLLWGEKGIREYFPESNLDYTGPYRAAMESWKRGEFPDPLTALEVELAKKLAPEAGLPNPLKEGRLGFTEEPSPKMMREARQHAQAVPVLEQSAAHG